MAIRYKALTELYQETQRKVTAPAEWQQFLTSACRNYRLSFDEQLLVYAQRPDATAVLEIERWNKRFGRWVNRGANGIAVFDGEHSGKQRLKYYFDVSDTHEGRFSRPVPLWTVRPEYAPDIIEALENSFGELEQKKFCSRISTGDYDAIIIGHSQFEKIPMSAERQQAILQQQIDDILFGIEQAKSQKAERYTIKQMERTRKSLEAKLAKLNDQSRKDDVVTFEELGVDRIFIDESHYFKNLFLMTKMRNVGGIAQTEAQKSSDLFMKCQYLDELTGGRGVIFATGTPISNSMVELYTIQRYLQYRTLQEMGLIHFDDWASNFGETITAIELSPEGSGYRAKTRFAKFYNLPELMSVFKQVADIQTADMLHLPVPKANFHTEVIKPSEIQQEMIKGLAERAEKIRGGGVDPHVDNMLRITNDGRKLALDMRLIQPLAPDDPDGKVAVCARNVYEVKVGKDITVRPYDRPHGRKLARNFGEAYSLENIRRRILAQSRPQREQKPEPKQCRLHGDLKQAKKATGFRALYFHYCYLLGVFPKKQNRQTGHVPHALREDLIRAEELTDEARLLSRHRIDTLEQLNAYQADVESRLSSIMEQRKSLYRKQRTRAVLDEPGRQEQTRTEIAALTAQIKELRREVKLCGDIALRSVSIKDKIRAAREEQQAGKTEKGRLEPERAGRPTERR